MASRIKQLRKTAGLTQAQIAEAFGVSQAAVAAWEKGKDRPGAASLIKMGSLAPAGERAWWLERAGVQMSDVVVNTIDDRFRLVPLLKDAAAAGTPRAVDEKEIEKHLAFPTEWVPRNVPITALKVQGDSMSPLIDTGYIVLVDTSKRDPKKLANKMIAAREGGEITIKWLRQEGKFYQLVPQHTSKRHPVKILTPESDVSIVGEVVRWIGEPPR